MNKQSLRDFKREATGHALSEAAFELAMERGLDGFIVEDVVQRAGYSRRTFANHFSCKEEAVATALYPHHHDEEAESLLSDLPEDATPINVLYQLMKAQFTADMFRRMRDLLALSKRYPTLEPFVLSVFRRLQIEGHKTLDSLFQSRYPEGYSHILIGAVYGAILPVIDGSLNVLLPGDSPVESPGAATFDQYLDMTFGYLRSGF
ncbi:TetR family transcriptional regulator [Paenibacillus sambharensis]|uniref:TetR family transcriptional regulator n=1 Tax=Paenibacillus sambharensis TaxID=1803190 RepID=A0A2W1LZ52_9BACL|nr:TetR/AcrR family transcriptional regulator [Paenibacillus sambharensis]PZD96787.1 TetR family transcriptional regulator [Paenibacillus sambharensis]